MKKNLKNKKGNIYEEEILAIISILFIVFLLFVSSRAVVKADDDINKIAPELSYQFPALFVHSFLMMKIDNNDVENLNLDINQNYFVKDLLKINSDESLNIVDQYKEEYLRLMSISSFDSQDVLFYYKTFSNENIAASNLLVYQTGLDSISGDLESAIKNKDYFFYFKDYNDKFVKVSFKG